MSSRNKSGSAFFAPLVRAMLALSCWAFLAGQPTSLVTSADVGVATIVVVMGYRTSRA